MGEEKKKAKKSTIKCIGLWDALYFYIILLYFALVRFWNKFFMLYPMFIKLTNQDGPVQCGPIAHIITSSTNFYSHDVLHLLWVTFLTVTRLRFAYLILKLISPSYKKDSQHVRGMFFPPLWFTSIWNGLFSIDVWIDYFILIKQINVNSLWNRISFYQHQKIWYDIPFKMFINIKR